MVLSQTWSASQAEIGFNSCSSCRYHERLDTGNDLIGPFSVDDFFGSGPIQRSHGNIRIGLSKVVVSTAFNSLETRQGYEAVSLGNCFEDEFLGAESAVISADFPGEDVS